MKKGTAAAIVLSVTGIAVLVGLAVYLSVQFRADFASTNRENEELLSEAEDAVGRLYSEEAPAGSNNSDQAEADEEEVLTEAWTIDFPDPAVIWSGDSRTVGIQRAVKNYTGDQFIAASGEGYEWLYDTGVAQVEDAIRKYPNRPVVFNFGVNDYENLENYLSLYEAITQAHPDTVFYFLSVNPIDPEECETVTNEEIRQFNEQLAAAYPDTYIDSYNSFGEEGFDIIDGIHYSESTYRKLYQFVKENIVS